jgi:hypothetical protein
MESLIMAAWAKLALSACSSRGSSRWTLARDQQTPPRPHRHDRFAPWPRIGEWSTPS